MRRVYHAFLVACVLCLVAEMLHAQPPFRRRELSTAANFPGLPGRERKELRDLMMTWIDPTVIGQHLTPGIHCNNEFFFSWHRTYIAQLEAWLMTQNNGTKYIPTPKWNPLLSAIPNEFFNNLVLPGNAVDGGNPPLVNQNITASFGSDFSAFMTPSICAAYTSGSLFRSCTGFSFGTAADNFAKAVEDQHGSPHVNISGSMGSVPTAPAAAIFFMYHGFIDDIWRYYQCQCQGAKPKDLYMKDDPLDIAEEPNTTAPGGVYWNSPDIWVRQNADPYIGAPYNKYTNEDDISRHQNPEYKALGGNNYVYVRIRNNGCQTVNLGEVNLRVYWSKASSGVWTWPVDWTTLPQGSEITVTPIPVPTLQPGEQWVAEVPWVVPNPALYPLDPNHFCLLARLESVVDPMTFPEGPSVYTNTRNNNNIAWRNVMVYDTDPFNIVVHPDNFDKFFVGVVKPTTLHTGLRFDFPNNPALRVTVNLGQDLYNAWNNGGRLQQGITYLGEYKIQINTPGARIYGIPLTHGAVYRPAIQAYVRNSTQGGQRDVEYGRRYNVVVSQYETDVAGGEGETVGGIVYEVRTVNGPATGPVLIENANVTAASCPQGQNGSIDLDMAGDATTQYTYWWSHGAGTRVVNGLKPGDYNVVVRDQDGNVETRTYTVGSTSTLQIEMNSTLSHCDGANGSASVAVAGGNGAYAYKWYRNGTQIQGANGPSVQNAPPGTYRVEVVSGSCMVSSTIQVRNEWNMLEVYTGVVNASGPTVPDGEAQAHPIGMPPYTYLWSTGATTDRITGLLPGQYWVDVTDMAGCVVRKHVQVSSQQSLQGVDRGNTVVSNTAIAPNPTAGDAELRYRLQVPSQVTVELYDNMGRRLDLLFSGVLSVGDQTLRIETAGLASGKYTVRIVAGDVTTTVPLVVLH